MFQGDLGKAPVAGAAGVAGLDGLGDGALDAGAGGVALPPGLGFLLASAALQGFMSSRGCRVRPRNRALVQSGLAGQVGQPTL